MTEKQRFSWRGRKSEPGKTCTVVLSEEMLRRARRTIAVTPGASLSGLLRVGLHLQLEKLEAERGDTPEAESKSPWKQDSLI